MTINRPQMLIMYEKDTEHVMACGMHVKTDLGHLNCPSDDIVSKFVQEDRQELFKQLHNNLFELVVSHLFQAFLHHIAAILIAG